MNSCARGNRHRQADAEHGGHHKTAHDERLHVRGEKVIERERELSRALEVGQVSGVGNHGQNRPRMAPCNCSDSARGVSTSCFADDDERRYLDRVAGPPWNRAAPSSPR